MAKKTVKKTARAKNAASVKYKGSSFDFADESINFVNITDATLSDAVLDLHFSDQVGDGYCAAKSKDGVKYTGNIGYVSPHQTDPSIIAEFTCYRDKTGAVLLNGMLTYREDNSKYRWIVQLQQ